MTPGSLARATAVMEANPAIGFVYGHAAWWQDDQPLPTPRVDVKGVTVWPGLEWLGIMCRLGHNVISSPEVVVRTSVQQAIGGYLPELPHTGDAEMWMRFALHSDVAYVKGVDQAYYRIHAGADDQRSRDLRRPRPAQGGLRHALRRLRRPDPRARAGCAGAPGGRWPRRPSGAPAAPTSAGGWTSTPITELVEFAESAYPHPARLPEYWGLRWREKVGPQVCPYLQPLMVSAVHRRVRSALWWRRWAREGV